MPNANRRAASVAVIALVGVVLLVGAAVVWAVPVTAATHQTDAPGTERQTDATAIDQQTDATATGRDVSGSTSGSVAAVEASDGNLTASLSTSSIAAGVDDAVTVNGTAPGSDSVRVYLVGPRGRFYDTSGDATGERAAEFTVESDGSFSGAFSVFDRRGTYTFVVAASGSDGAFADTNQELDHTSLPTGKSANQATLLARDEHSSAAADDRVVELTLDAEIPRLTVTDFTAGGEVTQTERTVSGVSNRAAGTALTVQVLEDGVDVVEETNGTVDEERNRWSATLDLSDVDTGTYTLWVDDGESTASLRFIVVSEDPGTPAETPTETPTDAASEDGAASASDQVNDTVDEVLANATGALEDAENVTGRDLPNPAETTASNATNGTDSSTNGSSNATGSAGSETTQSDGPGFGVGVGVAALLTAVLLAVRGGARE